MLALECIDLFSNLLTSKEVFALLFLPHNKIAAFFDSPHCTKESWLRPDVGIELGVEKTMFFNMPIAIT